MKKKTFISKFLLVALTIFLFIGTVCIGIFSVGHAATLEDDLFKVDNIQLSASGHDNASRNSESQGSIRGQVQGKAGGACSSGATYSTDLTITYKGDSSADIFFNYTVELNGGSCSIDGQSITANGSYEKKFSPNQSFRISLTSSESENWTIISITNFSCFADKELKITLLPQINGSFTFDGSAITETSYINTKAGTEHILSAIPNDGFVFLGRNINNILISESNPYKARFSDDSEVYPYFISNETAVFSNSGKSFPDLNEAINYAINSSSKTIVLIKSGKITGDTTYNIPSGITLYIPDINDGNYVVMSNQQLFQQPSAQTPASPGNQLIVPDNTNLIFEDGSTLYVDAICYSGGGGSYISGCVDGKYGEIKLTSENSKIILKSGSTCYCYGYITGKGTVEANSGSIVHEIFQIGGFRGGTNTSAFPENDKKIFPFANYFVQNIESTFIIFYGSQVTVHATFEMLSQVQVMEFPFIGNEGVFVIKENSKIIRTYDYNYDRINYDLYGFFELSQISFEFKFIVTKKINSADYVLPITNNFTISLHSSYVTVNQSLCFLPGTILNIDSNSELTFSKDIYIIFYDGDDRFGNNFAFSRDLYVVNYCASLGKAPTNSILSQKPDAELDLNGSITINNGGCLYVTGDITEDGSVTGGANIHSSLKTGRIIFEEGLGTLTTTYQTVDKPSNAVSITIHTAFLKNGTNSMQGEYFIPDLHKDEINQKTISFYAEWDCWVISDYVFKKFNIVFKNEIDGKTYESTYTANTEFIFPQTVEGFEFRSYTIKGWLVNDNKFYLSNESVMMENLGDITAVAVWGGRVTDNDDVYYLNYDTGEKIKGLNRVETKDKNDTRIYLFDENTGSFLNEYSGVYKDSRGAMYLVELGCVVENYGFNKVFHEITPEMDQFDYVFVKNDFTIYSNDTFSVFCQEDDLPSGNYSFDVNGYVIRQDTSVKSSGGQIYIKGDTTYIDGIKVSFGLFAYDGHYYYSDSNCKIVKNSTHYVSITNGLNVAQGLYYFDENGYLCNSSLQPMEVNA